MTKATAENRLHRELKNLVRPSLLIIDEVGYLTLDATWQRVRDTSGGPNIG